MKKFSLVLALALLASSPAGAKTRVAVIGAGLAGLTTAYELLKLPEKSDLEISVYEAKDRVGGRVFTVKLNGNPVEMGGENINDGGSAKTIRKLVKELGLKIRTRNVPQPKRTYRDPESNLTYDLKDLNSDLPITEVEMNQILADAERSAKSLQDVIDAFFARFKSEDAEKSKRLKIIQKIVEESMHSYEGGQPKDLSPRYAHGSLPYFLERFLTTHKESTSDRKIVTISGGNSRLPMAMASRLGQRVFLNHPLREISKADNGVFHLQVGEKKVQADIVVLAIPAKPYRNIRFGVGTIDPKRVETIASVAYGTHAKILVPMRRPTHAYHAITQGVYVWSAPDEPWATYYFTGPAGIMKSSDDFQKGFELGNLAISSSIPGLKSASVMVPQKLMAEFSQPLGISWGTDPDIQASYSFYSPELRSELERTITLEGEEVLPLFAPIDGKIFFAGEHTTVAQDIRGTLEAAVESGAKAARLIKKYTRR